MTIKGNKHLKTTPIFILTLLTLLTLLPLQKSLAQQENTPTNAVSVIYFLPSDRTPHQNINEKLDTLLTTVQKFFEDEMNRNGFGRKSFKLQTDANGKTLVYHINGEFNTEYYNAQPGAFNKIFTEISEQIDTSQNIHFIAADITYPEAHWRGGGQATIGGHTINYIPYDQDFIDPYYTGHELAHSFGLRHDFRDRTNLFEADILSYTVGIDFNNRRLSKAAAEWLNVHPYFNDTPPTTNELPSSSMLPPREYPPNAISLRFEIDDPDGLHQAQLHIPRESGMSLSSYKSLDGKKRTIVEFITTELTATIINEVLLGTIDVNGNFWWTSHHIPIDDIQPVEGPIHVDSSAASTVRVVFGDKQYSNLNSRLLEPFVVTVRDAIDEPVAGVQVVFKVVAGEGTLSVTNPWTDSDGRAETYLTLGDERIDYRVTASVDGASEQASFNAFVDINSPATSSPIKSLRGHRDAVMSVAFSPDGSIFATSSADTTIRLWNGLTGEYKKTLSGHTGWVNSVAFSPDGEALVSGSGDDTIRIWDVASGTTKLEFNGLSYSIPVVAYFPDGSKIASGTLKGEIHIWDATTGQLITSYTGHSADGIANVSSLDFNPDGSILLSSGTDRVIRLWDTATGQQIREIDEHSDSVEGVFNNDGNRIASVGAWDRTARLWDVDTGRRLKIFHGHNSGVYTVAFSPDGMTLATGSFNGTIRLWDTTTGLQQKLLIGHTKTVRGIAFSPTQNIIVSVGRDDTVNLWEYTPTFIDPDFDDSGKDAIDVIDRLTIGFLEKVAISEIMVATNNGNLPQWIELHNYSDGNPANMKGWTLEIQNRRTKRFHRQSEYTTHF